jgi:hypothetical protein
MVALNYLYHTKDYALIFDLSNYHHSSKKPLNVQLICDANYANRDDRKSLIGAFGFIENCLIFAHCKTMTTTATSSSQSESHGIFETWKYARFLNSWCQIFSIPLGMDQVLKLPIAIFNDSSAAIAILSKYINTSRIKHFDVQVFAVRDDYTNGFIDLLHIERKHNVADILTHRPTREMLEHFCNFVYVKMDINNASLQLNFVYKMQN